jgi:hypothetical protein
MSHSDMSDDVKALLRQARAAFTAVHRYATQPNAPAYMSVPADRKRDADLLHVDALDELEAHIDGECQRVAAAVAEERLKVVAFLRAEDTGDDDENAVLAVAAARIERGDHE